jgi:hypothetical protein
MLLDYSDGERSDAAWRVQWDAVTAAVYRPDAIQMVSDDPVETLWLV